MLAQLKGILNCQDYICKIHNYIAPMKVARPKSPETQATGGLLLALPLCAVLWREHLLHSLRKKHVRWWGQRRPGLCLATPARPKAETVLPVPRSKISAQHRLPTSVTNSAAQCRTISLSKLWHALQRQRKTLHMSLSSVLSMSFSYS